MRAAFIRGVLRTHLLAATLTLTTLLSGCGGGDPSPPNIVLIMADDMGYSDLGSYGSEIPTPHIDGLATDGLRFTHFYNAARCCPTRASLLTGLYPHQAGIGGMVTPAFDSEAYQGYLNETSVTLAEVLKSTGYRTLMSGKWHVGEDRPHWPTDRGFDRYFGLISGAANYFDIAQAKWEGTVRQMAVDDEPYQPPAEGFYMTRAITDRAIELLGEGGPESPPFFLYVAYTAPHWPLHALPEDIDRFLGRYERGWDVLREERYRRMIEMKIIDPGWPLTPRDEEAVPWDSVDDKAEMDRRMAIYAAQIYRMDLGIGRILEKLQEMGEVDETLVLFLSDNGACHETGPLGFDRRGNGVPAGGVESYMSYGRSWSNASNTPFRMHKHWTHEGGISTPLIVRWPAVIRDPGRITDQVGHIVDIMATLVDVSGATYPRVRNGERITEMEGRSLRPIFSGRTREPHEYIFWEHEGSEAVRKGRWKLVARAGGDWELYDLEKDRSEMQDLSADLPEVAAQLQVKWEEWAGRVGVVRR